MPGIAFPFIWYDGYSSSDTYTSQAVPSASPHSIFSCIIFAYSVVAGLAYYGGALGVSNAVIALACYIATRIYCYCAEQESSDFWVAAYGVIFWIYNPMIAFMVLDGLLEPEEWDVNGVMLIVHGTAVVLALVLLGFWFSMVFLTTKRVREAFTRRDRTEDVEEAEVDERSPLLSVGAKDVEDKC